jgi:catechol 2,3-dioxygenase-like lactoylglutathione lyase family enzyme
VSEELVSVRYMVNDVQESIDFFIRHFGFELRSSAAPAFADVVRIRTQPGEERCAPDGDSTSTASRSPGSRPARLRR